MLMMTVLLPCPGSNRPISTILHAELSGGISLLKHVIIGERALPMKHSALATADRWNGCEDQNGNQWCKSASCSTFSSAVTAQEDRTQHRSMRQL